MSWDHLAFVFAVLALAVAFCAVPMLGMLPLRGRAATLGARRMTGAPAKPASSPPADNVIAFPGHRAAAAPEAAERGPAPGAEAEAKSA